MVAHACPDTPNGKFLECLIFDKSTKIDWDAVAQLIKKHYPLLKKQVEDLEHAHNEYMEKLLEEKRKIAMPKKYLSEVYGNPNYKKLNPASLTNAKEWKVGDEGVDVSDKSCARFLVIPDIKIHR